MDALSKNGSTALLVAAREGSDAMVRTMLQFGADPNDGGDHGWSPLFVAAAYGHGNVIRTLISYGAPVNCKSHGQRTPLHEAVEAGHIDACETLVKEGADMHALDSMGVSPLVLAASQPGILAVLSGSRYISHPPIPVQSTA